MSAKTNGNYRQEREGGGNHSSFKNNNNSQNRGGGGRDGINGRGRRDYNGRNRGGSYGGTRSWTSDNAGSKWTPNNFNKQSTFPKFRESNKRYQGTRNMSGYSRNHKNHFDQCDYQTRTQQNMVTLQKPAPQQNETAQQMPAEESKMAESTTNKPTIVKDLTTENAGLGKSSASNIGESALTELRKEDSLPIRFPMETIENRVPKIKEEKIEPNESKLKSKPQPQPQPKSSSSSSSSSSAEESNCDKKQEVEAPKPAAQKHDADDKKIKSKKAEHKSKKSSEPTSRPNPASSSSSEGEETSSEAESSSFEEHMPPPKTAVISNKPVRKVKTSKKLKTERKRNSDEDVVCLGKAKNKFNLDDEEPDSDAASSKSKNTTESCILCDKKGHTSFECQMICKNCTKPYHNLKHCPLPTNMSLMMQNFMEFLMQQMVKYNPQAAYSFEHMRTNGASFENAPSSQLVAPGSPAVSSNYGKRRRGQATAKLTDSVTKKSLKKRRTLKNNKKDIVSDEFSSDSPSESETSSEATSDTYKRKNSKTIKQEPAFMSQFPGQLAMPAYSALPGYGAAAAFNPMIPMLNQMIQNGYPVHSAFNFKQ